MAGGDVVVEELRGLCVQLSDRLRAVHAADGIGHRLILPTKRDKSVRVSEQESRVLLCHLLERSRFYYSVETPTDETYQQQGSKGISARSDLSIYDSHEPTSKLANIELKARNPGAEEYRKDFEKLLRERVHGLWFHTLANSDSDTFRSVFSKIARAFEALGNYLDGCTHSIVFAFCVLQQRRTWIRTLELSGTVAEQRDRVRSAFASDHAGWSVHPEEEP